MSSEAEQAVPAEAVSPEKPQKKRSAGSLAAEFFIRLAVTVLAVWLLLTFVAGVYVNHTNSCYPMIKDGDLCITLRTKEPVQGDVIAYRTDEGIRFGRVIAKGGDTVEIMDDYITVNGLGVFEDTVYPTSAEGSKISYPYTVPEGSYFLLNDFRSDVSDSRTLGGVSAEDSRGKIIFIMRRRGF